MKYTPSIPYGWHASLVVVNLLLALFLLGHHTAEAKRAVAPTPTPPSASASFAYPTFTSLRANPLVWGTADHLHAPLSLVVIASDGAVVYASAVATTSGPWRAVVYPGLPNGTYAMSLLHGTSTLARAKLAVGASPPTVAADYSLGTFDVSDGKLMRFAITGGANGTSIGQLTFAVAPNNVSLDSVTLYAFTDSAYTTAVATGTDASIATVPFDPSSPVVTMVPVDPLVVPPDSTYYFELDGTVTPGDADYSVTAQLLSDTWQDVGAPFATLASSSNLVWSPNTFGTSSLTDADWLTGSAIPTLYPHGLTEERYATPVLACDISASTSSISTATPVTVTWTSSGASNASWASGAATSTSGSVTVLATSTRTFIVNFWGPLGATQCYTTVYFGQAIASTGGTGTSATSTATTTAPKPLGTISATPTSGVVPLTVTLSGTVNGGSSCAASTYTLGFGDRSTTTIAVAKNVCKPQSFSIAHRYSNAGVYVAKLYAGTFAAGTTTPLVASTTVTVTATKVGIAQTMLTASVWQAFESFWSTVMSIFGHR